jgi:AcrR family transcriptional regulator
LLLSDHSIIVEPMERTLPRARRLPAVERRAEIVAAATPLVRRFGRGVTTSQIAAAAAVSEGTLFHVFADKDAIIDAVIEVELRTDHVLAELEAVDAEADLRTRVVAIVEVLRRRLGSVFELMTAVGMTRPPGPPPHRSVTHAALLSVIAAKLDQPGDRLRYSGEETATLIRLLTFAATHPAISDNQPLAAERIADVLLHGIADLTPGAAGGAPC